MDVVIPQLLVDGGVRVRLVVGGTVIAVMDTANAWRLSQDLANEARKGNNVEAAINGS